MPEQVEIASTHVKVLLVDDEPQIRNLLRHLLMKVENYYVLTASSGEEALILSREHSERIDILITDIEMGGMSGVQLYSHFQQERPETPVLFISGKADGFRKLLPDCPLLEKPFPLQEFIAKVAEVLSTPR